MVPKQTFAGTNAAERINCSIMHIIQKTIFFYLAKQLIFNA
jgi:hypothetical protein